VSETKPASVYVTRPLPGVGAGAGVLSLKAAGFTVDQHRADEPPSRPELLARSAGCDALLCMLTERVDVEVMDGAPRLKVVANYAVGYDNIDVAAATARGILVTNTPDVLTEATADLAWALLLATARRVIEGDAHVRQDRWPGWGPTQLLGAPVYGRTLGIFGMGKIGAAVARRAAGFAMPVIYHNRSRRRVEGVPDARFVEMEELLASADFVSLHASLNDASRHVIDGAALARMKPTAILINTARGPLIDEGALVAALGQGIIAGVGLDVFEREPIVEAGLRRLANTVLLPHIGSATTEARGAMAQLCCDNIIAVLRGQRPLTPLNAEAAAADGSTGRTRR
jgi:glyoxylate reductase